MAEKKASKKKDSKSEKVKSENKSAYDDSDKESMYYELRADGKTDTQARQIVALKSR